MLYRLYFRLTFVPLLLVTVAILAVWPHTYAQPDGFGFYIPNLGGYHIQWIFPI